MLSKDERVENPFDGFAPSNLPTPALAISILRKVGFWGLLP